MRVSLNRHISLFFALLMSMGLAISTLHSHHHLKWHQQELADTGHCISEDTTVCPISGYVFETDILSDHENGATFFNVESITVFYNCNISSYKKTTVHGRAPPFLV